MARDYKQKHYASKQPFQRRSQQQAESVEEGTPLKWVWLMALLVTLLLLSGFFIVQHFAEKGVKSSDKTLEPVASAQIPEKKIPENAATAPSVPEEVPPVFEASVNHLTTQPVHKIHYSFYEGLAKTEVVVNVEPISIELPSPYFILAGTFTDQAMAEKEQKRLSQDGQALEISKITSKGKVYYRLRLGPFTDRLVMNKERNVLRKFGVDTLLIRGVVPSADASGQKPSKDMSKE